MVHVRAKMVRVWERNLKGLRVAAGFCLQDLVRAAAATAVATSSKLRRLKDQPARTKTSRTPSPAINVLGNIILVAHREETPVLAVSRDHSSSHLVQISLFSASTATSELPHTEVYVQQYILRTLDSRLAYHINPLCAYGVCLKKASILLKWCTERGHTADVIKYT